MAIIQLSTMGTKGKTVIVALVGYLVEFATFVLLLLCARYILCAVESRGTFIYDGAMLLDHLFTVSGLTQVIAAWLTQFYTTPAAALCITAALLTLATGLTVAMARKITSSPALIILAFAPSLALVFIHYNPSYSIVGTVAYVVALLGMTSALACRHRPWLQPLILLATYALAGATGLLAALIVMVVVVKRRWAVIYPLIAIGAICLWAWLGVKHGAFRSMAQALTPAQYYIGWHDAPSSAWLPWGLLLLVIAVVRICGRRQPKSQSVQASVLSLSLLAIIAFGYFVYRDLSPKADERFAKLSYYVARSQWDEVISSARDMDLVDTRLHNCLNLALAEKGQLAKALFLYPCKGPASIIDLTQKSTDMYMLLSDVFYSMGHLSLAMKYAFEANEGVGNHSPRMLKRLIDLNIIAGEHQVAEKYIKLLERTLHYADWAHGRRQLLQADAAVAVDAALGPKLRCLGVDNRFAGVTGIESDLRQILRHNPSHTATMDYLGCLYLLSKNVPAFTDLIAEYYGTVALPATLPKHFQEAIAVASLANDQTIGQRYRLHPSVVDNCHNFWAKGRQQPNTFWHYLKHTKLD